MLRRSWLSAPNYDWVCIDSSDHRAITRCMYPSHPGTQITNSECSKVCNTNFGQVSDFLGDDGRWSEVETVTRSPAPRMQAKTFCVRYPVSSLIIKKKLPWAGRLSTAVISRCLRSHPPESTFSGQNPRTPGFGPRSEVYDFERMFA